MIAYSWLVTQDGSKFEGRGYRFRNGANNDTKGTGFSNSRTISICFVGNYHPGVAGVVELHPTDAQLQAAGEIIAEGKAQGNIVTGAPVVPHSHVHATACCGDNLRASLPEIADYTPQGSPMHPDAQSAVDAGIWNGSRSDEPATREEAGIMVWRAKGQAETAAAESVAGVSDTVALEHATLSEALRRIEVLEARVADMASAPAPTAPAPDISFPDVMKVHILGPGDQA